LASVRIMGISPHFLNDLEVIREIIERKSFRVMGEFERCPVRRRVSVEESRNIVKFGDIDVFGS
ncbi:hypothetical protein BG011_003862, partial [Mortierella polycephala]